METFSALLAICAGNSPVTGEFPAQRLVTRSFDVFFDLRLNKRLSKQSRGWWFETLSHPLWRHRNVHSEQTQSSTNTTRWICWKELGGSQVTVALHYKRKSVTEPFVFCDVTQHSSVFSAKCMYIFCSQLSCHRLRRHVTSSLVVLTWLHKIISLNKKFYKRNENLKTYRVCCDNLINQNISDL